ncbi:hypothetical protein SAY87_021219 [Trapa incisa]|uniref:Pentatricopeptide repeat-containing protein n=1 Tax=Trapa incisa TaxID=236973 RepID=A0AAN7JRF7_9MYRT|nr:hypothetical protein SAY87_021219 [Trapa incisa]
MLCRSTYGDLSTAQHFFKHLIPVVLYSSMSTASFRRRNPVSRSPKRGTRIPASKSSLPPPSASDSAITAAPSPEVSAICSLLSRPRVEVSNMDHLLGEYKVVLSSPLVLDVLKNYRALGRVRTLEFFSWAGSQMGFRFDDSVVEYVVDFLCRRKLFDDVRCLLVAVSSQKGRLSSRSFAICIRFLGRHGRVRDALCLFEEMEVKFMCKPDNFVYNNMLYVLCKKENSEELVDVALTIFRRIEHPDTYSYSNVLVGLCKFGRLEPAIEIFQEMCGAGVVPTRSAVNILMGHLCLHSSKEGAISRVNVKDVRRRFTILVPNVVTEVGALEPALVVFWEVFERGLLPSAFVIKQLVGELCRLGRMVEVAEVLKALENKRLTCLEECYSEAIKALCKNRLVEEAGKLLARMLSSGIDPKLGVYSSLISVLCKVEERLEEAEHIFEIMKKKRCIPDNVTYTAMIHAYARANKWELAHSLLVEMLSSSICPHYDTHSLVDQLLKENGRVDLSLKLEEKVESQILLKYCKSGRLEAAYQKFVLMLQKGLQPPVYVIDAFKSTFQKHGKDQIAQELLEKINKVNRNGSFENT